MYDPFGPPGSYRAAFMVQVMGPDGKPQTMIYPFDTSSTISVDIEEEEYSVFPDTTRYINPFPKRITIEGYIGGQEIRRGDYIPENQTELSSRKEIEHG